MASQLHEAVRLAQAGQRDNARHMLRQVVQSDPNNEMAWLWLASVAADQVEYERALTEVLRVNPGSQQARDLLTQFRQQYRTPPQQTPPPQAQYQPPQYQQPQPQATYQAPEPMPSYYGPPQGYTPAPTPAPAPTQRKKARGCGCRGCGCSGCGCIPTCLIITLLLILIPLGSLVGLGVAGRSLGPIDLASEFLPGEAGRKSVSFTYQQPGDSTVYDVSATVPRGWFVASEVQNDFWSVFTDVLDEVLPLANNGIQSVPSWNDLTNDSAPRLLEVNPVVLSDAGGFLGGEIKRIVELGRLEILSFQCADVENLLNRTQWGDYILPTTTESQTFTAANGLCGVRLDSIMSASDDRAFQNIDPPNENHETIFLVPIDEERAALWVITVPRSWYNNFSADITRLIETVEVTDQSR